MTQTVLHIEAPLPPGTIFGIGPALCGQKRPVDYRMLPPNDARHRRASRQFFAESRKKATCQRCIVIANMIGH
jgi:hypothetical protein